MLGKEPVSRAGYSLGLDQLNLRSLLDIQAVSLNRQLIQKFGIKRREVKGCKYKFWKHLALDLVWGKEPGELSHCGLLYDSISDLPSSVDEIKQVSPL